MSRIRVELAEFIMIRYAADSPIALSVHETLTHLVTMCGYSLNTAHAALYWIWVHNPDTIQLCTSALAAFTLNNRNGQRGERRILQWRALHVTGRGYVSHYTILRPLADLD